MELILRAGFWIKFCKLLAKVICPYNYYSLFFHCEATEYLVLFVNCIRALRSPRKLPEKLVEY